MFGRRIDSHRKESSFTSSGFETTTGVCFVCPHYTNLNLCGAGRAEVSMPVRENV